MAGAFAPAWSSVGNHPLAFVRQPTPLETTISLYAKKKTKVASLEGLDLDEVDDHSQTLSKKELRKLKRKQQSPAKESTGQHQDAPDRSGQDAAGTTIPSVDSSNEQTMNGGSPDNQKVVFLDEEETSQKSRPKGKKTKKTGKSRKSSTESANDAKKGKAVAQPDTVEPDHQSEGQRKPDEPIKKPTLEEKVRKERPPPRVRIAEGSQPGFVSLRLQGVSMVFRDQEVLKDATWGVQSGDRIGVVGKNGTGKTTQLRILAGELEPTTGDIVKSSSHLTTAMLRQEFIDELDQDKTLMEEFMTVFEEETRIVRDIKATERELESIAGDDTDKMQSVFDRLQGLQEEAQSRRVFALESRIRKTMDLMGFQEDEGDDLVASFSGGWKMRIGLGKVLLKEPNVLLLDEPTNHMDLDSVEWLEAFLRELKIPMVVVSHDREFLDKVCTKIVDIDGGICKEYKGSYSRFLELKKAHADAWQASYEAQEKKIKAERQWMQKFKSKQPDVVKQRQAKLEKFLKSDAFVRRPPHGGKPLKFRFPEGPRLNSEVGTVQGLSHAYDNGLTRNRLFDNVDLTIQKGDRIGVVGPNGSGKSTLLRLVVGSEDPDDGIAKIVGSNVVLNYFEQNQADALDLSKTVLETIQDASDVQSFNELRALLGQFLFKGDDVEKKVESLSGGEKARLSLCCMMLKSANLLVLDEPTNHLDIPAKEMVEEALQHFVGTVLVVSHDRYFLSKVATTIVSIEDKKLVKYQGDYRFYMDKVSKMKEQIEARYIPGIARIDSAPILDLNELTKPKRAFGGAKTAHLVSRRDKGVKNAKRRKQ